MRRYAILFLLLGGIIPGCSRSNPPFRKLAASEVDAQQRTAAEQVATRLLEAQRDGKFEKLGEEATAAMQAGLTPEVQKKSYQEITGLFGDFKSLQYVESWKPNDGTRLVIHRFKASFTRSSSPPEIRVVMDGNHKLSGLWMKPWHDTLQ